jgi:hypothetical protein
MLPALHPADRHNSMQCGYKFYLVKFDRRIRSHSVKQRFQLRIAEALYYQISRFGGNTTTSLPAVAQDSPTDSLMQAFDGRWFGDERLPSGSFGKARFTH